MNRLENELRLALRRTEPPDGFAERVLARLPAQRRFAVPRWYAAAAVLLIGVTLGGGYEYRRTRREAAKATADLAYALEVTSEKLQMTRTMVFKATEKGL